MNQYKKYIIGNIVLMMGLFTLLGCGDDFLERTPSNLLDEKKVFSNLNNAEGFLNNAYREIPSFVYRNYNDRSSFYNLGSGTDESVQMWNAANSTREFNTGNYSAAGFPLNWSWFAYYNAIRQVNIFIRNYDLIPDEVRGPPAVTRKKRLLGEAYGLRAYYHFLLYTAWGEIPLLKSDLLPDDPGAELPRSPLNEVVDFIIQDLETSIEYLPPRHTDDQFGRFTATVAKSLMARVYLYYASPLSNPSNDISRWEAAEKAAENAIKFAEENGYAMSLTENRGKRAYERIFLEMDNPETIWSSFGIDEGGGNYWDHWAGSLTDGGWYGEGPIQEFVDAYETIDGQIPVLGYTADNKAIPNPGSMYNASNPFANRDSRFYQTVLYHGTSWKGRTINVSPGGLDYTTDKPRIYYFWRKYMLEEFNMFTGSGMRDRRFILFRLSELYLNYAEARNELLSSPDEKVYEKINILRARGGLPALPDNLSKNEMREKIRHERRIELALENHRFWDVRRWKIAEIVDNKEVRGIHVDKDGKISYPVWHVRVFDKNKHYLFPIPQSEIDKSRKLTQNPGW